MLAPIIPCQEILAPIRSDRGSMLIINAAAALLTHTINDCEQSQQQLDQYDRHMSSLKESLDGLNRDRKDTNANEIDQAFASCYKYCAQFKSKSS